MTAVAVVEAVAATEICKRQPRGRVHECFRACARVWLTSRRETGSARHGERLSSGRTGLAAASVNTAKKCAIESVVWSASAAVLKVAMVETGFR